MGNYLDKDGLTRFKTKLLTEVDKRIASGGGSTSGDNIPTKEEILEGANRVTDVEVNPEVATVERLQTAIASLETTIASLEARMNAEAIPVGTVIAMSANSAPSGYLLCNGDAVSRTTYANLFASIGTTYGSGNGSTTFNVPNLVDKFIQGSDTVGVVKEAGLPNITGTGMQGRTLTNSPYRTESGAIYFVKNEGDLYQSGGGDSYTMGFDASKSNAIYGNSDTVQPPALTMRYYIKY